MEHVCVESKTCKCYALALEPSDNCPIHGCGEWPPRCGICGMFMSPKTRQHEQDEVKK